MKLLFLLLSTLPISPLSLYSSSSKKRKKKVPPRKKHLFFKLHFRDVSHWILGLTGQCCLIFSSSPFLFPFAIQKSAVKFCLFVYFKGKKIGEKLECENINSIVRIAEFIFEYVTPAFFLSDIYGCGNFKGKDIVTSSSRQVFN